MRKLGGRPGVSKTVRVVVAGASAALALGITASAQAVPAADAPAGPGGPVASGWEFFDDYWTDDGCRAEGSHGVDHHEWTAFRCRPGTGDRHLWVLRP
ncbi:hypothetical protein ADL29_08385 [Streptomyces chattanoogensis]|uniref:Uncharacterized protein n=1 Tax=Streptomyces chattanoogensis TaxID=66876 RepID=A0A0N0H298_9ACTN|nr:hypothetical protein ADL29_08385 [Streptomyces chattanoogensis]